MECCTKISFVFTMILMHSKLLKPTLPSMGKYSACTEYKYCLSNLYWQEKPSPHSKRFFPLRCNVKKKKSLKTGLFSLSPYIYSGSWYSLASELTKPAPGCILMRKMFWQVALAQHSLHLLTQRVWLVMLPQERKCFISRCFLTTCQNELTTRTQVQLYIFWGPSFGRNHTHKFQRLYVSSVQGFKKKMEFECL